MFKRGLCLFFLVAFVLFGSIDAKLPQIDSPKVVEKVDEILKAHASHKELTPELLKRVFINYADLLDPSKTYFIKSDIEKWIEPTDPYIVSSLAMYKEGNFTPFFDMHEAMIYAIARRKLLDQKINVEELPKGVKADEFKEMEWTSSEQSLLERLKRIKALQIETSTKLDDGFREKALQRIDKHQAKREEEILHDGPTHRTQFVLSNVLKATASALDAHTSYFTPGEAAQFMINVQQRLFGIGAQLRDDLNGFTVIKIVEGGPAAQGKQLKNKDRIVAVDGEPVVGMDIVDAVELIRGKENTEVTLTVMREVGEDLQGRNEQQLDITITRGEVVLKESRYESSYEPFADGVIGYLKLFSFYQDPEYSSTADLAKEIQKLKKEHNVKGLILDLRYNSGGMLSQAVGVSGLFMHKGIVVGIKDNAGNVQYLRDLDERRMWDGPLIILVNKASASASEIVAQTLKDYNRAIIVGDEYTYGKGSFQTFTLNANKAGTINPEGEYKVTRGRYYTVSGKTPQLTGVKADIILPGPLSSMDLGEQFAKYPLENDSIQENYDDDLSDIPFLQRKRFEALYKFNLQKKEDTYSPFLSTLRKNSQYRIEQNKNYQSFLKEMNNETDVEAETEEAFGQNDLQLTEAYNIMKDLIYLMNEKEAA